LRDEFLMKLAHDMGGALGAIMGYASVLDEDDALGALSETQRRCLKGIMEGAESLDALIDRMRAYGADRPDPGASGPSGET
jgi:signal transduction histidine kinase